MPLYEAVDEYLSGFPGSPYAGQTPCSWKWIEGPIRGLLHDLVSAASLSRAS